MYRFYREMRTAVLITQSSGAQGSKGLAQRRPSASAIRRFISAVMEAARAKSAFAAHSQISKRVIFLQTLFQSRNRLVRPGEAIR